MSDRWRKVPYPAWWIARANKRRALLDVAVARLRERLPSVSGAIGALVFGSYATGRVGPTSDLDVMVIVDDDGEPWNERCARASRELDLGVPCDLIVYAPDEFALLKATRNFVARAVREGLWFDATTPG